MKRLKTWIPFLCLLTIYGCMKDISGEIPANEPRLTLNGFFNPRIPVAVSITKSVGVLDTLGTDPLTDIRAYLYENGTRIDSLTYYPNFRFYIATQLTVPQPGNRYRLEITAPGLPPVSAESFLPDSVGPVTVTKDTLFYPAIGADTYWLRVRFIDPGTSGDFYHLAVYRRRLHPNNTWSIDPVCFESADPAFEVLSKSFCSGGVFNDAGFNGQEKELLINTKRRLNAHLNDSVQFVVELRHASEPYYRYNKSLMLYKNNQGDIFSQPAPILGNVTDGYGIFAGYAPVTDTLKLP